MSPADQHVLHSLLSAVVDGTASEVQVTELSRRLEEDAETRRFYVRYLDMHAFLQGGQLPRAAMRPRHRPWLAFVSSLVAASLLVAWLLTPPPRPDGGGEFAGHAGVEPGDAAHVAYVATVAAASPGAILDGDPVRVGMRLTSGPYVLMVGSVDIRFDGGARILLEDASRFTIHSRRVMQIDEGTIVFQGDQTCEPIEVVSPHSVFRNIGTRYAAVIDAQGEELHVAEGAVRRTAGQAREPTTHQLVEAGSGLRFVAQAAEATSIPLDQTLVSRSLDEDVQAASDAGPIVTDGFRGGGDCLRGTTSGAGWSGPWESHKDSLRLASPGLSGVGSVAVIHDGSGKPAAERKSAANRRLQTPIDLSQDGIWYLRFLVRRGPVAGGEHRAMLSLRTGGLTDAEELERNSLVQIALRRADSSLVRIADSLTRASLPQIPGQTYAVVVKIVAGRAQPDQVLVSLMAADRLIGSKEPTEWSLVSESVDSDARLDRLSLECASNGEIAFGDICIGPTWSSVAKPLGP